MPSEPRIIVRIEPLVCSKCGIELGKKFYMNGMFVGVTAGGILLDESAHGRCMNCDRGVHITVSSKVLRRLDPGAEIVVEFSE